MATERTVPDFSCGACGSDLSAIFIDTDLPYVSGAANHPTHPAPDNYITAWICGPGRPCATRWAQSMMDGGYSVTITPSTWARTMAAAAQYDADRKAAQNV